MNIAKLIKPDDILKFVQKNLPTILSVAASVGVVGTGFLAFKAGVKKEEANGLGASVKWTAYIPPIACGAATIACIISAEKLHLNREAALAAAVAFWKDNYNKLDAKMTEALGEEKAKELKREIVRDDIPKDELKRQAETATDDGKMLCYEPYTKQFFRASKEQLLWAELTANKIFAGKGGTKLNDIIELFPGCKKTQVGDSLGWFLDDFGNYKASYYFPRCGHQFIDIQPYPSKVDGVECLIIEYGLCPYKPDEPEEWENEKV